MITPPIFTLDFEASGLGPFTYPIDVGVAAWRSPELEWETWSALIQPAEDWMRHRLWDVSSEEVHGIQREDLCAGLTPKETLTALNTMLSTNMVYCDGGEHDLRWLRHLEHAAGLAASFHLTDYRSAAGGLDPGEWISLQVNTSAKIG